MLTIHKSFSWDMGHRISQHGGKCFSPHGHRYNAAVWLEGNLNDKGMVMDFYQLSQIVDPIVEELDHAFMVYENDKIMLEFFGRIAEANTYLITKNAAYKDAKMACGAEYRFTENLCITEQDLPRLFKVKIVPFESTAENIAKYIFDKVYEKAPNVVKVEVWETPKCCAVYEINLA